MGKKRKAVICVSTREATLKKRLRRHLGSLGFHKTDEGVFAPPGTGKDVIRTIHSVQRDDRLAANQNFISEHYSTLIKYFASGKDIDVARITPVLQRISGDTWESDLFRLAALTWSVPVSNGFGRRLRYLVWDSNNNKLMGIIAIGDPVFNLSVRDNLIDWDARARGQRLVNIMDAYVLGALPPYNALLGGKLVACLLRSRDIYDDFAKAYGKTTGIISKQEKKARLLVVTTSSSMGRSSVYNRLKLGGIEYFKSIGYTGGWGHFHIPDSLFLDLREYLRGIGHPYADLHRFGQGPNWRMRTTRCGTFVGLRGGPPPRTLSPDSNRQPATQAVAIPFQGWFLARYQTRDGGDICLAGLVSTAVSSNTGRFGLSGFGWTLKGNTSATTSA
jgi:hypothetical protein